MGKLTCEEFINKALIAHNGKYTYDNFVYVNSYKKSFITCPEHGDFLQNSKDHLRGNGCIRCAKIKIGIKYSAIAKAEFKDKATIIHNGRYTYDNFVYIGNKKKSFITCPEHGDFLQQPSSHLNGNGCVKCAKIKIGIKYSAIAKAEFKDKATIIHNGRYTYDNFVYKNAFKKGYITCPEHGDFLQIPNSHLRGQGCPDCAESGFNKNKPAIMYYIKIFNTLNVFYKVGITKFRGSSIEKDVFARIYNYHLQKDYKIIMLKTWIYNLGSDCLKAEQEIHRLNKCYKVDCSDIMDNGYTETYKEDILELDKSSK